MHTRIKIIEYYWIHISLIYIFPTCYMLYIPMEIYAVHFIFATHIHTHKCLYFFCFVFEHKLSLWIWQHDIWSKQDVAKFRSSIWGAQSLPALLQEAATVSPRPPGPLPDPLPGMLPPLLPLQNCHLLLTKSSTHAVVALHPHFTRNTLSFSFTPDQQPVLHHHMLGYCTKEDFSGIFSIFTSVHFWTCNYYFSFSIFKYLYLSTECEYVCHLFPMQTCERKLKMFWDI